MVFDTLRVRTEGAVVFVDIAALEVMLSADDYDADLAERYGWINRALPARTLGEFA